MRKGSENGEETALNKQNSRGVSLSVGQFRKNMRKRTEQVEGAALNLQIFPREGEISQSV